MSDQKYYANLARCYLRCREGGPSLRKLPGFSVLSWILYLVFYAAFFAVALWFSPILAAFVVGVFCGSLSRMRAVLRSEKRSWPYVREVTDWDKVKAYVEHDEAGIKPAHKSGQFKKPK